ncbi:MAG: hypothetical protein AAFX06_08050 [Planctomycetota bacterium]
MPLNHRRPPVALRRLALAGAVAISSSFAAEAIAQQTSPAAEVPTPRRIRRLPPVKVQPEQAPESQKRNSLPVVADSVPAVVASTPLPPSTGLRNLADPRIGAVHHPVSSNPTPTPWLRSITTDSCSRRALERLEEASREYAVGAWASAEASGWEALEQIARGIDIADRQTAPAGSIRPSAARDLSEARAAIREAGDFTAFSTGVDSDRIETIVASHQTPVLRSRVLRDISDTEAADRYLDYATQKLSPLARVSVHAARAMDLIAAVRLGRDQAEQMPLETSLCLRRAAFSGQPGNGSLASRLGMQLAEMGLDGEAQRTLKHAQTLEPSQEVSTALASVLLRSGHRMEANQLIAEVRNATSQQPQTRRTPEIIELTPEQFASISPAHNRSTGVPAALPVPSSQPGARRPRQPIDARAVGFRSGGQPTSQAQATRGSDEYSEQAFREDRDPAYYKSTRPTSTIGRILGKLPKFPKFRAW